MHFANQARPARGLPRRPLAAGWRAGNTVPSDVLRRPPRRYFDTSCQGAKSRSRSCSRLAQDSWDSRLNRGRLGMVEPRSKEISCFLVH
jgi:hypothetical protein